jgi:hypothetical protein
MMQHTLLLLLVVGILSMPNGHVLASKRGHDAFQLLKQTKERVKQGARKSFTLEQKYIVLRIISLECLPPSKYYAGSCYTYMKMSPAPSWERAHNNCLSLPMMNDASLLAIETVDEYEFIERELIGLKSGSESVSVYIGLRKVNSECSFNGRMDR